MDAAGRLVDVADKMKRASGVGGRGLPHGCGNAGEGGAPEIAGGDSESRI
jgi:hypothetical protein